MNKNQNPFYIFEQIEKQFMEQQTKTSYPPYNIEEVNEDTFLIKMAVAGIKLDDISIIVENQVLTVKYDKSPDTTETKYLYKGISTKSFSKDFKLNEYVLVDEAVMDDGLLIITLKKVIPEELKPKTIPIKTNKSTVTKTEPTLLTE